MTRGRGKNRKWIPHNKKSNVKRIIKRQKIKQKRENKVR